MCLYDFCYNSRVCVRVCVWVCVRARVCVCVRACVRACVPGEMDAEMGSVFLSGGGPEEADGGRASWSLETSFPCSDVLFANPEKPLQDWLVDPSCAGQVSVWSVKQCAVKRLCCWNPSVGHRDVLAVSHTEWWCHHSKM